MIRFVNQSIKYGIFGEGFPKIPYSIKPNSQITFYVSVAVYLIGIILEIYLIIA